MPQINIPVYVNKYCNNRNIQGMFFTHWLWFPLASDLKCPRHRTELPGEVTT